MERTCLLEPTASRLLLRSAVKGILDQIQRWIKTSAPHFTSISPTFLEHCSSAAEVNNGCLFCAHAHLWPALSLLFLFHLLPLFVSFLTVTLLLPLSLCLLSEVKLAHSTPFHSARLISFFVFSSQAVDFRRNQVFRFTVKRWGVISPEPPSSWI